jgi:hypothetical protein
MSIKKKTVSKCASTFSVYRYCTVAMREVACKLHQLSPQWGEERKRTYVRHAARECSIHKQLRHAAVVGLYSCCMQCRFPQRLKARLVTQALKP